MTASLLRVHAQVEFTVIDQGGVERLGLIFGETVRPKDGKRFTLAELQALVDGTVERVHVSGKTWLICDEDGQNKLKPANSMATLIARKLIVGDVVLLSNEPGWMR